MGSDAWLKLHTSLLTSAKFCKLPTNEHRWAFICLLLLAKKGLESAPEGLTIGHLFMNKKRWRVIRADLIDAGLLDADGSVNGFEDSQLSFEAIRQRRQRERNKGVTNGVTGHVTRHGKNVTDAEAEAYTDKKEEPPKPPAQPRGARARTVDERGPEIRQIVEHLAAVTGRAFAPDKATDQIRRALVKDHATVAEAIVVIDHLWAKWGSSPDMAGFVDKVTPFRRANFQRYLDEARAGGLTPRPAPAGSAAAPTITREMVGNLDWLVAEGADAEAWIATQPRNLRQRLGAMLASRLAAQDDPAMFHDEQSEGLPCPNS